jgi:hypothetical protein
MTVKNAQPTDMIQVACMIINSIDTNANADPDTLLKIRDTPTHKVIITHLGQKFTIPNGTLIAAAQASAQAGDQPQATIKDSDTQPAKTQKKTTRKRTTTAKPKPN